VGNIKNAHIWDTKTAHEHILSGHTGAVSSVAITPDGRYAVTGSVDRTARIWNMKTGEHVHTLSGHENAVQAVAISSDGYVATYDGIARTWNMVTGQLVNMLSKLSNLWIREIAISPDGRYLLTKYVTKSWDRTARIWDMETGDLVQILPGETYQLAISPDGRYLVTASKGEIRGGAVRIWNMPPDLMSMFSGLTGRQADLLKRIYQAAQHRQKLNLADESISEHTRLIQAYDTFPDSMQAYNTLPDQIKEPVQDYVVTKPDGYLNAAVKAIANKFGERSLKEKALTRI